MVVAARRQQTRLAQKPRPGTHTRNSGAKPARLLSLGGHCLLALSLLSFLFPRSVCGEDVDVLFNRYKQIYGNGVNNRRFSTGKSKVSVQSCMLKKVGGEKKEENKEGAPH